MISEETTMHTVIVMAGGLALLAVCLLVGRTTGSVGKAPLVFIPLWLIGAAINMWIGVNRAGYSYADEFPIFLLIFAGPAALAAWLWWAGY
jgi:hypothetical protein